MLCPYDVRQFPFAILGLRKIEKKGQEKKKGKEEAGNFAFERS